jgi:hypothetical protein
MRLRDVFLIEGAKDASYRKTAEDCANALLSYLQTKPSPYYVGTDDEGYISAGYKGKNIPSDLPAVRLILDSMYIFLSAVEKGDRSGAAFAPDTENDPAVLTVYIKIKSNKPLTEDAWKWYCKEHAGKKIAIAFEDTVHEFIHAIDSHRISDRGYLTNRGYDADKLMAGDKEERKKYVNRPLEANALFQQYASAIDSTLRDEGIDTAEEFTSKFGNTPTKFVKVALSVIPDGALDYMDEKTKRAFMKRFTQMWYDLRDRYSS